MILAGNGFGVVLEAWKLTKAVTVGIVPREAAFRKGMLGWLPYRLDVRDKHVPSEEELRTQEYDRLAFKICGIVMGPVLVAYTIYSALYQEHKGWWSFTIGTLSSFVYAFGFVSLIPQVGVDPDQAPVVCAGSSSALLSSPSAHRQLQVQVGGGHEPPHVHLQDPRHRRRRLLRCVAAILDCPLPANMLTSLACSRSFRHPHALAGKSASRLERVTNAQSSSLASQHRLACFR